MANAKISAIQTMCVQWVMHDWNEIAEFLYIERLMPKILQKLIKENSNTKKPTPGSKKPILSVNFEPVKITNYNYVGAVKGQRDFSRFKIK